jgi:WS/DGAT/MGAT family acyltransferase
MEQLSGTDSLLLYEEKGNVYNHISGLGLYDSASAKGGLRFRDILKHFERRLNTSKVFRRRLVTVPHAVDRPYWMDDPDVDIEFHVRHIALPKPGDWRQLMIQVARIHSRALDLAKPLWEIYVIEGLEQIPGLPDGTFAVLYKFHSAALDGQAIANLIRDVHASTAHSDEPLPAHQVQVTDREPSTLQLYSLAISHSARRALKVTGLYAQTLHRLTRLGLKSALARVRPLKETPASKQPVAYQRAPECRFNAIVSPARVVEAVDFPIAQINRIRECVSHASVSDVFLTTIAGALRHYLKSKGELPAETLRALMPVNLREPGFAGTAGPSATGVPVSLCTDIRDPLQRLRAVHEHHYQARHGRIAELGKELLPDLINELPNFAVEPLLQHGLHKQVNCIVSHVTGPSRAMYVGGAKALCFYPVGRVLNHAALNVSAFTYIDDLWISIVACRSALPDPAFFAECMRASFDELLAAASKRSSGRRKPVVAAEPTAAEATA